MTIGQAVKDGLVDNETLGYFMTRTQLFLEMASQLVASLLLGFRVALSRLAESLDVVRHFVARVPCMWVRGR